MEETGDARNFVIDFLSGTRLNSVMDFSVNHEIAYVVNSGQGIPLTWVGGLGANLWDVKTTHNWKLTQPPNTPLQMFYNLHQPLFHDSLANTTVYGESAVAPGDITNLSTANNYTWKSATQNGYLYGASSFTKDGPSALTNLLMNTFFGNSTILNGTVVCGQPLVNGNLGVGDLANYGTLVYNGAAGGKIIGRLTGTGNLYILGNAQLTLLGDNSYSGTTILSNLTTLNVGTNGPHGTLGTGDVQLNDGSVLNFNVSTTNIYAGAISGPNGTVNKAGSAQLS